MTKENFFETEQENEIFDNEQNNNNQETADFEAEKPQEEPKTVYVKYVPYGLTPETYEEKLKIRAASRTVGWSFMAMTGIVLLLNLIVVLLSFSTAGKAASYLFEAAAMQAQQILFSSIAFTLPFIAVFKITANRISDLISFKKPEKSSFLPLFLFGIAFCAFSNISSSIASQFFAGLNIDYDVDFPENPQGIFGFLLTVISTVIMPALVEEFACRGLTLGILRKFGDGFAIVASSILFGVMHGNFEQMPFAIMVGLILGFVTVKSGTIWVAVAIHAFNNAISVVCEYALASLTQQQENAVVMIVFILCMIGGIIGFALTSGFSKEFFSLETASTKAKEKQKYKWFFTSFPILIFIIINIVEAFSFFLV